MKKHGHAHRGAAIQSYRRHRRVLDLATPSELAVWVNQQAQLAGKRKLAATDNGVQRLWLWLKHRVRIQPNRATRPEELLKVARRFLPDAFA
jgi:hypothetical protein